MPAGTFYVQGDQLKSPEEILWTLNNYGITKDKTVIVTCNTNFTAGGGMFIFRYLGYPDVKVHGDSWSGGPAGWSILNIVCRNEAIL